MTNKSDRGVVCLSGGIDSAVCLGICINEYGAEHSDAIFVKYGQKNYMELEYAHKLCDRYGVRLHIIDLSNCFCGSQSSLLKKDGVVQIMNGDIKSAREGTEVPFRNGLFISAATSLFLSMHPDDHISIFLGNHATDCSLDEYPDCSEQFNSCMKDLLRSGTGGKADAVFPLQDMYKKDIVALGSKLHVPFELTWSCYERGYRQCGKCIPCIQRKEAFASNGIQDPAFV